MSGEVWLDVMFVYMACVLFTKDQKKVCCESINAC